ncbi:MAG: hypothetical protein IJR77_02565 [Bacteroidales bacterium]|nr:hypothetical protein [Bacteroidales bacterium]
MKSKRLFLAAVATTAAVGCTGNKTATKPNIVFFLVDDYGWLDSSVAYGEEVYPNNLRIDTPNMQRLSERSSMM